MPRDSERARRWRSTRGQLPRGIGRFSEPTTFLIVFTTIILVAAAAADADWVLAVAATVGAIWASLVYRSGIRIEGDTLKKDGLLGVRNKPPRELAAMYGLTETSWSRDEIAGASEGKVAWGRSLITGIKIHLKDGSSFTLPYSYCLGQERRQQWIRDIGDWANSED